MTIETIPPAEKLEASEQPIVTGCSFENLSINEVRQELAKLQTLAIAVSQCSPTDVPGSVYKAWSEPLNYRRDELHWLREKFIRLVEASARVVRAHDDGSLAACDDSVAIQRLRDEITGASR